MSFTIPINYTNVPSVQAEMAGQPRTIVITTQPSVSDQVNSSFQTFNSHCSIFGLQADSRDGMFNQTEPGLLMKFMFISDVNVIMVHVRFTTD